MAKLNYLFGADEDPNGLELCMTATRKELLRLQQEPELFPSKDVEERFWREVQKRCGRMVERAIPAIEARDEARELLRESIADYWQDLVLPTGDVQRKPWEQFLHNGAPGSGADVSRFGEDGSVQILPMAASRIMIAMLVEYYSIAQALDAVSFSTEFGLANETSKADTVIRIKGGDVPVIDENTPVSIEWPHGSSHVNLHSLPISFPRS